ncbi:HEAT repeat domain-containing protein [Nannocystaceae bacterium ST9]
MKAAVVKAGIATAITAASLLAIMVGMVGLQNDTRSQSAAEPEPEAALRCHFEPGEQAAFALESTVRDVRGEATDRLGGTLSWEVTEQLSATRWRLRAALSDVSHTQSLTLPEERVTGSLTEPFFVDIDASCRLVDFGFVPQWEARKRRLVQSALATHEFVLPPRAGLESWTATQSDGLGSFEASYAIAPSATNRKARVDRRKAAYAGQGGEAFGLSLVVVASEARANFDPERPQWLTASAGLERVQILVQGQVEADLLQRFSLLRDDARFVAVPQLSPDDADFRDPADLDIEHERLVDAEQASRTYDEAIEGFLAHFVGGDADPSYAAARELAGWLKSHPEGAQLLAEALRDDAIDDAARPALFLGLELSGTDESRGVLSELLVDPQLRSVDRARAASALADIGEPTRSTAELLLAQAQSDGDPMVANVSVLGLGSMAKRSGDDELRSYVRDSLDGALASAADESHARVLLDAMGNTGDSAFADTLESHLAAESAATREHAAQALGRLDPEQAGPRLLDRLELETDPAVSVAIVGAYEGPASVDAIAAMSAKLTDSTSVAERAALINWLGAASSSEPAAQRLLVAHVRRETDVRLLQQIGAYVPAAELR